MEEFAELYADSLAPLLTERGLVSSTESGRTTPDSVFSRLFALDAPAAAISIDANLQQDPIWKEALRQARTTLGAAPPDTALPFEFALYRTPAGPGHTVPAGPGRQRGPWHTFDATDGLSSPVVKDILEDRQGHLWFATVIGTGVCRYDGGTFTLFTPNDGLPENHVFTVAEDSQGDLWFGTHSRGVARYDGKTFAVFTRADGLPPGSIQSIAVARDGNLWFTTSEGGVCRYDGETFHGYTAADGLTENRARTVLEDRDGRLWFSALDGVIRYHSARDGSRQDVDQRIAGPPFTYIPIPGLADEPVDIMFQDRGGILWLGTTRGSIVRCENRMNGHLTTTILATPGEIGHGVNDIAQDAEGNIWFAAQPGGISRYDDRREVGDQFVRFTDRDGLAGTNAQVLLFDREDVLWVGIWGGLSRYDGGQSSSLTLHDGLPSNGVMSVLEDRQGTVWFATWNGLSRYDDRGLTTLFSDYTWVLHEDRDGNLWLGGRSEKGLCRYDGRDFTCYSTEDGLVDNWVYAISEDREGNLWIGTNGGLSRFDGREFKNFTTGNGLVDSGVYAISEDREGNLWIGTRGGLCRFDGEKFETYTTASGLAGDLIHALGQDRDGRLWIGTSVGLNSYDGRRDAGEKFTTFTTEDGLAHDWITSIAIAPDSSLWIGTFGGGLCRHDGLVFQQLSRRDGLVNNTVKQVEFMSDGSVWIATEGGVTHYRPGNRPPSVSITEVIAGSSHGSVDHISLTSDRSFLILEFQGASFTTPVDRMAYVYRLRGRDDQWRPAYSGRVEYATLPTGEYTFEVRAVDRDLNYSREPARVRIVVQPPYARFALRAGLALALIGFAFATGIAVRRRRAFLREQRERLRAQEELNRELEEELQTAHDMQMRLMPAGPPQIEGLEIAGRCLPANHVGGDLFQYFPENDNLSICLADVTGHDMEAAVPAMVFSGILESEIKHDRPLEELFASLNQTLHDRLDSRTFVCFAMGDLDLATCTFRFANGGCLYPLHYRAATRQITELQVDAYPLGVRPETDYVAVQTQLEPGDRILFYSDGIPEATASDGRIFGFERTAEIVCQACAENLSPDALIDRLLDSVKSFTGDAPQEDDMTCVALQLKG